MATDLERLVVSLDADITKLTKQLSRAGVQLDGFDRDVDQKTKRIAKRANDNLGAIGNDNRALRGDQLRNLGFQLNDIATGLAGGQSPMTILAQQGGQVYQVLGDAKGGVGGAVKDLAARLFGLATPMTVAAGGVLSIGAAAAYLGKSWSDTLAGIETGLSGIGRLSGATVGDVNALAEAVAKTGRLSLGTARDIATAAAAGGLDKRSMASVVDLAPGYAKLTGKDEVEAGREIAKAFRGGAKGVEELDQKIGALDGKTLSLVRSLFEQGKAQEAINVATRAMQPELARVEALTGAWARAWTAVKNGAAAAAEAAGRAVNRAVSGEPIEAQIERLRKQREQANGAGEGGLVAQYRRDGVTDEKQLRMLVPTFDPDAVRRLDAELDRLTADLNERAAKAQDRTDAAKATKTSKDIEDRARSYYAEAEAVAALERAIVAAKADLQDQKALGLLDPETVTRANEALSGSEARLKALRDAYAKGGDAAALALKQAEFTAKTAGLSGYARAVADIRREFELAAEAIRGTANEAAKLSSLERVRDLKIGAAATDFTTTPTSYRKGVVDAPAQYQQRFLDAGAKYGIDPNLVASVAYQESRFDPAARNKSGAGGMMQFMPGTAKQYGIDPMDPAQAIDAAAKMLAERLKARNGNVALALADYNYGAGNVDKAGGDVSRFPKETRDYIGDITRQTPDAKAQVGMVQGWEREEKELTARITEQAAAWMKTTYEVEKAAKARELENQLVEAGKEVSDADRKLIDEKAAAYARLQAAKRASEFQATVRLDTGAIGRTSAEQSAYVRAGNPNDPEFATRFANIKGTAEMMDARDTFGSGLKGFVADLQRGASAADALRNAMQRIIGTLTDKAIDTFTARLFGAASAGAGGGDGFGSFLGSFGKLLGLGGGGNGFADLGNGAVMVAGGGQVIGPGSSTSDSIPARLSSGEFVVNAAAARGNLDLLYAINSGGMRAFADGGPVTPRIPMARPAGGGSTSVGGMTLVQHIHGGGDDAIASIARQASAQAVGAYDGHLRRNLPAMVGAAQRRGF